MSRAACTCEPGELPSTSCRRHGLDGGQRYPPMDRHALAGETAGDAQRRLYLNAATDRQRVEAAGYVWPLRALPARGIGQR